MSLQKGAVIWITGLSASGKTTLSRLLSQELKEHSGLKDDVVLLDGEELRACLSRRYGYTPEERFAVVREIVKATKPQLEQGKILIVATISHQKEMRLYAREHLQPFMEVYLDCPMEVCAGRDYKDQYLPALRGEIPLFVGVAFPYEKSDKVELSIDTHSETVDQACSTLVQETLNFLAAHKVLPAAV